MKKFLSTVILLFPGLALASGVGLSGVSSSGPIQFVQDGSNQTVTRDTVTPGNSFALPIINLNGSGNETGTSSVPFRIDPTGSTTQPVSAASLPLPSGAATDTNQATEITALGHLTDNTQKSQIVNSSGTAVTVKDLATQVVSTDNGLVTNTVIHGLNSGGGGSYVDVKVNPSGALTVDATVSSSALPTGAATSAKQDTGNTSLASIDGKLGSLGQKAMAGSAPVVIASDQSAIPASQSGTWNINNISGTVSLPTGAATAAKQPALGTAGTASADVITVQGIASMTALKVDGSAVTQPVSIAGSVQIKAALSATGSGSSAGATVSTVITATAPANAVGFVLQNLDTSTANIRWAVGRTATTTLGQQLQPGRDTGYIPIGANVSICAESGTQNYDIQWIAQ